MSEEEKNAIDNLKHYVNNIETYNFEKTDGFKWVKTALNLLENQQKELEQYKRIAEMNLKDSEEFKENMCEHRCILNNQIMELTEELNQEKEKNKELEEHQRKYLDGELITANQGKFFEKIIKENYIRKDKIRNLAKNIKEQRNFYDKNEEAEWGQYNKYETYDYFYNKIKELLEE